MIYDHKKLIIRNNRGFQFSNVITDHMLIS